jgi:transposase
MRRPAVEHIGIDLGARHSHVVVLTGKLEQRRKVVTSELPRWLLKRSPSRVVMEACTQSPAIARAAKAAGHETIVVPGNVVRALGVGARGIKTDDRDAEVLARASVRNQDLPSVHLRSALSCSRRTLLAARATLVEGRKAITLSVKSWLRGQLIHLKGRAHPSTFCETVRRMALEHPDGLPLAIETVLVTYEHLTKQIEALDQELKQIAQSDSVCKLLQTIPGVGVQTSVAFTAQLDDPKRFASSDEVASYLALVPGESTTGGKLKRTGTIKAGPRHIKALLVQCAWSLWRSRPNEPMVLWARAIADRRGKRIAIVALARKLATVMWSMWKHDATYDPSKTANARAHTTEVAAA